MGFFQKITNNENLFEAKANITISMQNEIDCLKNVFPQEKKVRLGFLHF
jgi:hypothetical protein